ncbi:MAG: EAL domain-containing protein (putative c-di-GMP-specific phosphodiesterase class I) [Alphaproteobacteria bacterium]
MIAASLVTKLQSKQYAAIVATIINMPKTLGMIAVAEGVESKDIKHQLLQMGCIYEQGYLWSKPVCDEDFIALVIKGTSSTIP